MGAAFPLADLSISGQLREVAKPEEFRLVLNLTDYGVNRPSGRRPSRILDGNSQRGPKCANQSELLCSWNLLAPDGKVA